jgi:hypothetical protein
MEVTKDGIGVSKRHVLVASDQARESAQVAALRLLDQGNRFSRLHPLWNSRVVVSQVSTAQRRDGFKFLRAGEQAIGSLGAGHGREGG